jgi:bifunctional UDP-N-acetylglucosamine pyrophosphorylase/glucosamine-1-phosphate N-acetyltransferase
VVVLAAGEGRRMRSARPKVLHEIGGRPLLGHAVHAAAGLGPEHLVVVAGHGRAEVGDYTARLAEDLGRPVLVAIQERQLGTGDALACALSALPRLDGPVLVTAGDTPLLDTPTLAALLEQHTAHGDAVTVLTAELPDPTGYGRIIRATDGSVVAIVEQRDGTPEQLAVREVNSGVYVFDAATLAAGLPRLGTDNAQGELYLTDMVGLAHADGRRVGAVRCPDPWLVSGVNDQLQLAAARAELNARIVRGWMERGVTVVDPATTWVDVDVTLEADVVLRPGCQLHGRTTVATGAEIGPDTTLADCRVGAGATVLRTHGSESEIGAGATVGPFSYLRPGTRLGTGGKIGTFVEVKNSDIGDGTKVPHLTYVGDASIGEHSNIGCSSVFVNYDGVSKSRTVVGSHVRIGSDNTLVAPITIGDGAYTGAGAVIRSDVPPGALAVSAGDQRTIAGWVARRRPGTAAAEAAGRADSTLDVDLRSTEADSVFRAPSGDTVGTGADTGPKASSEERKALGGQ